MSSYPLVIQGGMGVGVSNWTLARAVSIAGQLGVVSGTAIDSLMVRRLQDGDTGGHVQRALQHFPDLEIAHDILHRFFLPDGRGGEAYKSLPMYRQVMDRVRQQITIAASFVEVWLTKEGHDGLVGINLLTKVQMPNLHTLYGAMLAGVDYVLMGAGIPKEIPAVLDAFAQNRRARIRLDVEGDRAGSETFLEFDPKETLGGETPPLKRPLFLPIIASNSLAIMLAKKSSGRIDGFVIEGPTAGGHNAPPRGEVQYNERGEPLYGERDEVDLAKIRDLGLPFWLAGGTGSPEGMAAALDAGATGIQAGTLFAYSQESGFREDLKAEVIRTVREGLIDVKTDARASPTGFPFKVVQLGTTLSSEAVYQGRTRVCDLGYLRTAYRMDNGRLNYRCPAEPVETYVKKGGKAEDTVGRKCLCNALLADIGHAQVRDGGEEQGLITSGDELRTLGAFLQGRSDRYSAAEAVEYLLSKVTP